MIGRSLCCWEPMAINSTPFPPSVHRLQEEATRLRDTLKAKSRRADRADELEGDLAKSEVSVGDVPHWG